MSYIFLIVNIVFYGILFHSYYKKRGFDITCYVISIYGFVALIGLYLACHPMSGGHFLEANILSLLYFFIAFCITLKPVSNCARITPGSIVEPSKPFFTAFMLFVALITLIRFPGLISNISRNFILMLYDTSYLSGRYEEMANAGVSGFSTGSYNVVPILGGMIDEIAVFLLMYYLTRPNRKLWITVVLFIASVLSPLGALVQARRGSMAFAILSFGAYYLLFKDCFTYKIKTIVRRIIIVVVAAITCGMTIITISRFSKSYMDDNYATYSMVYYVGQPMHYFCETIDPNGCRWGDRTIPLFKSIITDGAYTYSARTTKYQSMKLGEEVFSTYFGEILLDFGPILGFLFLLLLIGFLNKLGPGAKTQFQFYELIPIMMVIDLLICGWTQSPFSDVGGNLHFIFILLMYLFFKLSAHQKCQKVCYQ